MSKPERGQTAVRGAPPDRLLSLDQFRGYTVVGMLLVNFLGSFAVCPKVLSHSHDYVSYADTIMPQFLFAVGFAFRLTFGRRPDLQDAGAAYGRVVRRMLGLVLVSLVIYTVGPRAENWEKLTELGVWGALREPLKRSWFQTLMHIAATGLWLVPVVRAAPLVRIVWMLGSAAAHVGLSAWFNFVWCNTDPNAIDGGPLGFLTWSVPAIVGTLACDAVADDPTHPPLGRMIAWGCVLMGLGYLFSCGTRFYDVPPEIMESFKGRKLAESPVFPSAEAIAAKRNSGNLGEVLAEPPFVPPPSIEHRKWNYWMMSQRAGTLSYLTFSAGFSLIVFALFALACDRWGWRLAFFETFGTNALAAYVLHDLTGSAVKPFIPKDAPAWYAVSGLLLFFWLTWVFLRYFEKRGVYLRA